MPGFDSQATNDKGHDDPITAARNARYGVILFLVYLLVYAGFVVLSAFWPDAMAAKPIANVNLAILYGLGLILGALLLALLYGMLCRTRVKEADHHERGAA